MLHRLEVENFSSIRDPLVLDFGVAGNVPRTELQFAKPLPNERRIPRVVAFLGANAAGKSTVLRALAFIDWFVESSIDAPLDQRLPAFPFLAPPHTKQPTRLAIEFNADIITDEVNTLYRYELEIGHAPGHNVVLSESLLYKPNNRFVRIFSRIGKELKPSKLFKINANDPRRTTLNEYASAIGALAKFNHELSRRMRDVFITSMMTNIELVGRSSFDLKTTTSFYHEFRAQFEDFKKFSKVLDLGIQDIIVKSDDDNTEVKFKHRGVTMEIPLAMQSEGTQQVYAMYPLINLVLQAGGVAIVDELDSSVHPYILSEIIRMFRDKSINDLDAQLFFTCHNASILEQLSKEEVYVVEKDETGCTKAYGLKEVEGLRRDANLYQKYLGGAVGGLPRIG